MNQSFAAIILAGGIRASSLRRELGLPVLLLPLVNERTVLDAWLARVRTAGRCETVMIIVSSQPDARMIERHLEEHGKEVPDGIEVAVMLESARWRGTGGLVRDVGVTASDSQVLVVIEGSCVPPVPMASLLESLDGDTAVVGVTSEAEPSGIYALRRHALNTVPDVGFFDLKEQLLPALYEQGMGARVFKTRDRVVRVRDRSGYLRAIGAGLDEEGAVRRVRPGARVAGSARLEGVCLIEDDVTVGERAFIHDGIILNGASLGSGSIVSRSIIGPGGKVACGQVVTDTVVRGWIDSKVIRTDSREG